MDKRFLTTSEVAKLLGVSRIAVFKKIKSGEIRARKIGRNFVIDKKDIAEVLGDLLAESRKGEIEKTVKRVVREYGETLKLLGTE